MTVSQKMKIIDNKIEQNKAKYDLDRQTAKMPALNVICKYQIWIIDWQNCFTRKDLLEKAFTMKIFEYSLLGKELNQQNDIAKKKKKTVLKTRNYL